MPSELYFTTRGIAGAWILVIAIGVLARCCG